MLQGSTHCDGIALVAPDLPRLDAAGEVGSEPLSPPLTWEDREASGHDVVLGCPWAGEMEVCGYVRKGRRGAGGLHQPAFLSILPAASKGEVQALRWRARSHFLGDGGAVSLS